MADLRADSPVQYIKGVGPRRAGAFAKLGIRTIGDLLEYFPFRYELDQGEVAIADLIPDTTATVCGEVVRLGGRRPNLRCTIADTTGTCVLRWFNQPYGAKGLHRGANVIASGKVQIYDEHLELIQPRIDVLPHDAKVSNRRRPPELMGVYPASGEVNSGAIQRAVKTVLARGTPPIDEFLPQKVRDKRRLPERMAAVREMHMPRNEEELKRARRRLAYEELFVLELAMALRRYRSVALSDGQRMEVSPEIDRRIRARFPFALTASQDKVVREIVADLESGHPMTRLLQGDVGSGKTVVALYAALVAVAHRRQAAIMAPTEILAGQHFANIRKYLKGSRVRSVLLSGRLTTAQRRETLAAIERGDVDLVVGTQALIQKDVAFSRLALVVVDEQHKFGVLQRHQFRTKGPTPHYLVMTATPIPRTLSMTVFGDLDVSVIKRSPPGRGKTVTKVVQGRQWGDVMAYARQRLERGEQGFVVCPVIEGTEGRRDEGRQELASVRAVYERLVNGPWHGLEIGVLHGALPAEEKQGVIDAFGRGDVHAVVATTVVEVGVDVANATIMIVEHADRFGLSQLHQLRGRVGRGRKDSLCVLIARGRGEKAAERLNVLAETTDGFRIAEADLKQRGPGELFGTRQHGLPPLHVADIVEDFGLLEEAREDAFELIRRDPKLEKPEHRGLLLRLKRAFRGGWRWWMWRSGRDQGILRRDLGIKGLRD